MDWKEIGKHIVKIGAPLLGTALAGPAGGAIGGVVASAFGVDPEKPDEVLQAITTDPNALVKLKEIQSANKVRLQELVIQKAQIDSERELGIIKEVNATMRTEGGQEDKWQRRWRPFWGFISGLSFLGVCIAIGCLAYRAVGKGDPNAMAMIPQLIISFTTLFGVPGAILGITAWGRNKLKEKRVDVGQ